MRNTVLFQCSKIFFVIYYTWGIPKMVVIIFLICCFLLLCCDKNQLLYYKNICYVHSLDVPTVQVQQPSYSVTTGNSVTLVCTVSSSSHLRRRTTAVHRLFRRFRYTQGVTTSNTLKFIIK
jgi:hypothetical protein